MKPNVKPDTKLHYLSSTPGISGRIKETPEDFLVEEIIPDGTVLEIGKEITKRDEVGQFIPKLGLIPRCLQRSNFGIDGRMRDTPPACRGVSSAGFIHFVLQKRNWTTIEAVKELAKRLRISHKRFSFAGTKDRTAVSTQLVSGFGVTKEQLLTPKIKDIAITGAWYAADKVTLGSLLGNMFTISISGQHQDADKTVAAVFLELNGVFPNYFGEQRFGSARKNTHIIGEKLVRGLYEEAAMCYLTDAEGEQNSEALAARNALLDGQGFAAALKAYPKYLRMERMMLAHLARYPNDFVGAFKKLPRQILLLFIHALQSHLFNILLSERLKENALSPEEGEYRCAANSHGFPDINLKSSNGFLCMKLIGYESVLSEREMQLLDSLNLQKEDFRVRGLPEISSKGSFRAAFAPLKDFSFVGKVFRFSLQSGSYATVALREFMDDKITTARVVK